MHSVTIRALVRRLLGYGGSKQDAVQSHINRGKTLAASGRHADARAAFQQAIAIDANYAEAHYRCGIAWRDEEKFEAAAASYRHALTLKPGYIEAHNNLGVVLQMGNKPDEARECYRRAVELNPDFGQPYINLGRMCEILGDRAEAARCYRKAIAAGVDTETFSHLLSAAEGITTGRAPAAYSRTVFDNFAAYFDHRLVDDLGYRIPQILAAGVKEISSNRRLRVLDLGCGTGLCGTHIKDASALLAGVDLSPAMLARAAALGIYDALSEMDVAEYVQTAPAENFDVVLSADVFVYIGDLAEVFAQVSRVLAAGGIFAFSIEVIADEHDFLLLSSGRYAQSAGYITRLAAQAGFTVIESSAQTIRGAPGAGAPGLVYFLRKH